MLLIDAHSRSKPGSGSAAPAAAAARVAGTSARIGSSPARAASLPRLNSIPSISGSLTDRSASSSLAISSRTGASSGEPSSREPPVRELERGDRVVPTPTERELGIRNAQVVLGLRTQQHAACLERAALHCIETALELGETARQEVDPIAEGRGTLPQRLGIVVRALEPVLQRTLLGAHAV